MNPNEMNTVNFDGRAFNGNWRAVGVAAAFILLALVIFVITVI